MRLGGLVELASGIDAVYLSGRGSLPAALLDDLGAAQLSAREGRRPVPLDLGLDTLDVHATGMHRWPFRLENPRGMVCLTASQSIPTAWIQLRAEFIHAVGAEAAVRWFTDLLESLLGHVAWTTSRVDLFVDSQGWRLSAEDRAGFVCRADRLVTHEDGEVLTGFQFGSRKSGAVTARIYDKTAELERKPADWWLMVWGDEFDPTRRVLRVEFEAGRSLLKQTGLSSPEQVLEERGALWAYLTEDWLTFRSPTGDSNKSRWPVAPEWQDVQRASLRGDAIGLDRVEAGTAVAAFRKVFPAVRGYLATAGALLDAKSLDETMRRVHRVLRADEDESGVPFSSRIADKRRRWGLT